VASGSFTSDDPIESAWRLAAVLDGLGLQVVLHQSTMTRAQMRNHVRRAAALELGHANPDCGSTTAGIAQRSQDSEESKARRGR
jgi:hypothetical protein